MAAIHNARRPALALASRVEPDWPILPLLAVGLLIAFTLTLGTRHAWSADLVALLITFSVSKSALGLTLCWQPVSQSAWRWIVLLTGCAIALAVGAFVQQWLWPQMRTPHQSWVIPLILLSFVATSILPSVIQAEFKRKADAVLLAEDIKHRAERQLLEARLAALQGQIEPHFLYNTLANARTLIQQDAIAAEHMLNHLIAYLRAAMPDLRSATTTLGQELDRADAYLKIMQIRLGERLQFSIVASPQARVCLIPPLGVMTLVENAIKHGIEPKLVGGKLQISASCEQGNLIVDVIDDGAGFQSETGDGIGLINLQERLQALFDEAAELSLNPAQPSGIVARIVLPAQPGAIA